MLFLVIVGKANSSILFHGTRTNLESQVRLLPLQPHYQHRYISWSDACHAAGLADGTGADAKPLLAGFSTELAHLVEVEAVGDAFLVHAVVAGDIIFLAMDIACVEAIEHYLFDGVQVEC